MAEKTQDQYRAVACFTPAVRMLRLAVICRTFSSTTLRAVCREFGLKPISLAYSNLARAIAPSWTSFINALRSTPWRIIEQANSSKMISNAFKRPSNCSNRYSNTPCWSVISLTWIWLNEGVRCQPTTANRGLAPSFYIMETA